MNTQLEQTNTKPMVSTGTTVKPLIPTDMDTAYRMAQAFATSGMLPKSYSGTPQQMANKAFTAMQLGAEVGLLPMQAIQSIAVVNGQPSIWGDTQKALVLGSGVCEYIKEYFEGEPFNDNFKAVCIVKRKGAEEHVEEFSVADAKRANLWGKSGTWQTHPKRMLKYKARSFALRDEFPDVLKGLTHSVEEMEGEIKDVTPKDNTELKQAILSTGSEDKKEPSKLLELLDDSIKKGSKSPAITMLTGEVKEFPNEIETIELMETLQQFNDDELHNFIKQNYKSLSEVSEIMTEDKPNASQNIKKYITTFEATEGGVKDE